MAKIETINFNDFMSGEWKQRSEMKPASPLMMIAPVGALMFPTATVPTIVMYKLFYTGSAIYVSYKLLKHLLEKGNNDANNDN